MRSHLIVGPAFVVAAVLAAHPSRGSTESPPDLASPLRLADVVALAAERRDEITAALARTRAAEARPAIVSALDDPMISPSIDHKPFMMDDADWSVTFEQQFPLSGIRRHRRASALADVDRLRAEAGRTVLDVQLQAANAFLMLEERRRRSALVGEQIALAREVVSAADARYASGTAPQSDVLRAEVEVARLEALAGGLASEVRGAEAMLNASLGLDVDLPVPPLASRELPAGVPSWTAVESALGPRPELVAGRAEIVRAEAEIQVMRDMYRPMATVRAGPAYTMADGDGWMAMMGISLPLWRGKLRAGIEEAQAMHSMAEADLQAMARMIEGEAAAALRELEAARARREALSADVLPRARLAIEPAVASYAAGRLPLVSVVEALQALWSVELDLISADVELGLAWARLGRVIGSYEGVGR